jgi:Ca2+-binding RTX toxin-like protein
MIRSGIKKLSIGAALMLAACGQQTQTHDFDPRGFGGVESQSFSLLAADCTYGGTNFDSDMTVTVATGETAYVYYRPTDSKVVANAGFGGADCVTTATRKIIITGGAGAQKVLVDYVNAPLTLFAIGNVGGAGITIDLGADVGDIVTVRGTTGNDTWTLGQTGAMLAGMAVNVDAFKDITFAGVESVVLTTGDGIDTITGLGNAATGGTAAANHFPLPLTVWAGAGNDVITGGALDIANTFNGEDGDDTFHHSVALSDDTCNGGAGTDTATYATRTNAVSVTLDGTGNDGEAGEVDDIEADVENVIGGAGNDTIDATGSNIVHALTGNAGNDTLIGATDVDTLNGGAGDDILRGAAGADVLVGGAGVDTADYSGHAALVTVSLVPAAVGNEDTLNPSAGAATDIENLRGSGHNDSLTGNDNANIIWGGAGNDTILGGLGDDALYGEAGLDAVSGEAGDDVVVGGDGVDTTLSGGDGNDIVDAVDSGAGADDGAAVACGNDNDYALLDAADAALGGGAACELRN